MTMGPRVIPFEPTIAYYEFTSASGLSAATTALVNQTNHDGVQLNIRLGGYAPSWENVGSGFGPGLALPDDAAPWFDVKVLYPWTGGTYCEGWSGTASVGNPLLSTSNQWAVNGYTHEQYGATPTAGLHTYPGAWVTCPWNGYGYYAAVWMNQPVSYEQWFSTNDARADTAHGFSGYTNFNDQGWSTFPEFNVDLPDLHLRKYVAGIMRTGADVSNPAPADIMLGAVYTSDGVTTTAKMYYNGHEVASVTEAAWIGYQNYKVWFDGAWGGLLSEIEYWSGTVDSFDMNLSFADSVQARQWVGGEGYIHMPGFDSYDVKLAWYVDLHSPSHPVGTPVDYGGYTMGDITGSAPSMQTRPDIEVAPETAPKFWQDLDGTEEAP